MREIKFRAWNEKEEYMEELAWPFYVQDSETIIDVRSGGGFSKELKRKVQQYTGLKDKNGREIYEGDIIKVELSGQDDGLEEVRGYREYTYTPKIIIGEVRIRTVGGVGMLVKRIISEGKEPKNQSHLKLGKFIRIKPDKDEVIGNIYENKDLLQYNDAHTAS